VTRAATCKKCGEHIRFDLGRVIGVDGQPHRCQPKVKVFTDEEKRELEKKYANKP